MRITMKASSAACLLVVGLMSLSGCGKQTSEVHGTVTVNGEKVNSGNIVFIAEDGRLDSAVITDGFYTILKAPTGKVKITVESIAPSGSRRGPAGGLAGLPPEMKEQADAARKGSSDTKKSVPVPKKYGDEKTTDLTYEVTSGKQEHNIDLKP